MYNIQKYLITARLPAFKDQIQRTSRKRKEQTDLKKKKKKKKKTFLKIQFFFFSYFKI